MSQLLVLSLPLYEHCNYEQAREVCHPGHPTAARGRRNFIAISYLPLNMQLTIIPTGDSEKLRNSVKR